MNSTNNEECTCTIDGYSPDCPHAFVQGGRILHTIQNETRLKPRQYTTIHGMSSDIGNGGESLGAVDSYDEQRTTRLSESGRADAHDVDKLRDDDISVEPLTVKSRLHNSVEQQKYISSEGLRMGQNNSLDKFSALTIGGVSITEATIGGYRLDVSALAKKAMEVVPLPPIALPIIFRDHDLNFAHHFFQGLEIIAGRGFIVGLANSKKYHASDPDAFGRLIKGLITSGYCNGDKDLVIFVKRVISVTFEVVNTTGSPDDGQTFLVVSNFYGFQYIEGGMQCREQDLKMWLQSAYGHYKLLWFNAFKSSGVPDFALDGVQDRYGKVVPQLKVVTSTDSRSSAPAYEEATPWYESSRRRTHKSKSGKTNAGKESGERYYNRSH